MGRLKDWWRETRPEFVSGLLFRIVSSIGRTLRVEARGFEAAPERTIFCGWHGRSFPFATHFRDRGWWVIISLSRDGDIQNTIFRRLGYRTARGSTGRSGERAAVRAIKELREGGVLAMTPDGPRGPSKVVKEGVIVIASRSGAEVVPVGVAAKSAWVVSKSWDRYVVPKPFTRCVMVAGEPLTVPNDATAEEMEAFRERLEGAISRAQAQAEAALAERSSSALAAADR